MAVLGWIAACFMMAVLFLVAIPLLGWALWQFLRSFQ